MLHADNLIIYRGIYLGDITMTAFASLVLLIGIVACSMSVVAYSNYQVAKGKRTTYRLEKMKVRVEELEDVVLVLDSLCESRIIAKFVNDEIIAYYNEMLNISPKATYLSAGLANAQLRANELSDESSHREISRICKSDAQIARYRAYLAEALRILRKQHTEGVLSSNELQVFSLEIEWLQLQVKVISNIVEGHKAYTKHNILSANAFYKKAQTELIRSTHPDERRTKMISQVADMLFGRRKSIDPELMPETEFNPQIEIDASFFPEDSEEAALLKAAEEAMQQQSAIPPNSPRPQM